MGTCRCPFHRAAIMAVITCGAKFVSHRHEYYKYIKLYGRTRTSTPPANTSYHTRVYIYKMALIIKCQHASRRQLVNAFHSYWRSSVPSIPGRTVNGDMSMSISPSCYHGCNHLWCEVCITQHEYYYKYIKLYVRSRTSTPPANTSYHTRVYIYKCR